MARSSVLDAGQVDHVAAMAIADRGGNGNWRGVSVAVECETDFEAALRVKAAMRQVNTQACDGDRERGLIALFEGFCQGGNALDDVKHGWLLKNASTGYRKRDNNVNAIAICVAK